MNNEVVLRFITKILPKALDLIDRYRKNPKSLSGGTLFPKISNQRLNGYLKEMADLCGIRKNLTFHLAGHTFATTVTLSNGVPIESVSKMLAHTKITTTQVYANHRLFLIEFLNNLPSTKNANAEHPQAVNVSSNLRHTI